MPVNTNPLQSIDWGTQIDNTNAFGSTVTYSFGAAGTSTTFEEGLGLGIRVTGEAFNAYEMQQFEVVFDQIASITNLTFVETNNYSNADLRFLLDTNELSFQDLGVMVPPQELGEGLGVFNGSNWDRAPGGDLEMGGYGFVTIAHEVLHGMGLAHPHDSGGGSAILNGVTAAFDDFGNFNLNQGIYTTMTYNSGQLFNSGVGGVSSFFEFGFGYEAGPMALDIAVLQDKYGANMNYATGNNVYTIDDTNGSGTAWTSIWDAGGDDLIRYTGSRDVTIDLRAATLQSAEGGGGYLSAADDIRGGFTIANGVVIETAQGGSGNDALTGNTANNMLAGGLGNDEIRGKNGNDEIRGQGGDDRMFGDNGNDTLTGGKGDDQLTGGNGNDRAVGQAGNDVLSGGDGRDVLNGGGGFDQLNGGNGNDFVKGGGSNDLLNGGQNNDRMFGNRNDDVLNGGKGNDLLNGGGDDDRLNGGRGDDTLKGGDDSDTFVFNNGNDRDVVLDFDVDEDRLFINENLLNGQTTGQAIIAAFGVARAGGLVLDFGGGDVLTLDDVAVSDFAILAGQIDISGTIGFF